MIKCSITRSGVLVELSEKAPLELFEAGTEFNFVTRQGSLAVLRNVTTQRLFVVLTSIFKTMFEWTIEDGGGAA